MMRPLSPRETKRVCAEALRELKAREALHSNAELGDALGAADSTVRRRLEQDDEHNQLTVHELARAVRAYGPRVASDTLGRLAGVEVGPGVSRADGCGLRTAAANSEGTAAIVRAASDRIYSKAEARECLAHLDAMEAEQAALRALLEAVLRGEKAA